MARMLGFKTRADAARTLGVTDGWLRKCEGDLLPEFQWCSPLHELLEEKGRGDNEDFYQWYLAIAEGVQVLREKHGWNRAKVARFISATQQMKRDEFYQEGLREGASEVRRAWNRVAEIQGGREFVKKHAKMVEEQMEEIRNAGRK